MLLILTVSSTRFMCDASLCVLLPFSGARDYPRPLECVVANPVPRVFRILFPASFVHWQTREESNLCHGSPRCSQPPPGTDLNFSKLKDPQFPSRRKSPRCPPVASCNCPLLPSTFPCEGPWEIYQERVSGRGSMGRAASLRLYLLLRTPKPIWRV